MVYHMKRWKVWHLSQVKVVVRRNNCKMMMMDLILNKSIAEMAIQECLVYLIVYKANWLQDHSEHNFILQTWWAREKEEATMVFQ